MRNPGVLAVLVIDGALLGAFGLLFTPLYIGSVPAPMGALLCALVLPWLVHAAGEAGGRPASAGAPLVAWLLTVGVLGFGGPGGDVMLPGNWQSLLLVVGGLGTGLWALRGVLNAEHDRSADG